MLLSLKTFPRVLLATIAAFALTAAVLLAHARRDPAIQPASPERSLPSQPRRGASTDERIAAYAAIVKARPRDAAGYTLLAAAYIQKHRETGDAALLPARGRHASSADWRSPRPTPAC